MPCKTFPLSFFPVSNKSAIWCFSIEIKQELCLIVALCHPKRGCVLFTRDIHVCVITMHMSVLSARDRCSQIVHGPKLIQCIRLLMALTFCFQYTPVCRLKRVIHIAMGELSCPKQDLNFFKKTIDKINSYSVFRSLLPQWEYDQHRQSTNYILQVHKYIAQCL